MIDVNILKEQNKLTINDEGYIYIKPIGEYDYLTFPLETLNGCLAISVEEYLGLKANYYKINKELTGLEINLLEEKL